MENFDSGGASISWSHPVEEQAHQVTKRALISADAGLRAEWHHSAGGMVTLEPAPELRIRIHSGEPVGGHCQRQRFLYTEGDIDVMPAGYGDTWQEDRANSSLYLSLSQRLLHRTAEELGDGRNIVLNAQHQIRDSQIEYIGRALDAERRNGYLNGRLYTESLGTALAVHLLRRYPVTSLRGGLSPAQWRRLRTFIDDHLDQPLSLELLADLLGISSSHLKTLFRRSTGMPVYRYVLQRRVERARDLLLHGNLPISQVALDAGFSHQSHLARCMRRLLGTTPSALRSGRQ